MKSPLKNVDDNDLIGFIREGNRDAFGELYNRYYKKVYHRCLSFTKDPAEAFDLAQESLMKAVEKLYTFRGESTFSTWLFTITTRHCLAHWKKEHKKNNVSLVTDDEQSIDLPEPDNNDDRIEQESIMYKLLTTLPENELQLLTLKYQEGVSIESLQSSLDLSASAIKMRLKRSKEKLNVLYGLAVTYGLDQVLSQI